MLDDFFVRALIAGIGIAVMAGPLGCFVIWRRMAISVTPWRIRRCSVWRCRCCSSSI